MSSQRKRQERALEKRMNDGYPGLVLLEDLYDFEQFLATKGWRSGITEGRELMHVHRNKGEEIVVVFNEKKHQTTTSRRGMVLWYDWQIFWKEKALWVPNG